MLRVGLIGCGAISESHLTALCAQADVQVIACADVNLEAAQRRADQFEIPLVFNRADDLLELNEIDLVSICTPPNSHETLFINAIAREKHVLIEKPLALDLAGADRMIEAAKKTDRIVAVPLIHRYSPGYHALHQLIEHGAIGPVRTVQLAFGQDMYGDSRFSDPQNDPRSWLLDQEIAGGGILMSSTIHFLSVISHVLGNQLATSVMARVQQLHPKSLDGIEDDVELTVKLDSGCEILLHESWRCDIPYRCELIGDCGRLVATADNVWNELSITGRCQGGVPKEYHSLLTDDEFQADAPTLVAPFLPSFSGLMEDLVGSIQESKYSERLPDLLHARNMQAIVAACYQSERLKMGIKVGWREKECHALNNGSGK